jgi:hypothetical protein
VPRRWLWVLQVTLTLVAAGFAVRAIRRHWDQFRALDLSLDLRLAPLALSVLAVGATYALQIEAWRRLLTGWRQPITAHAAARAWCVGNLARYVPGKVWSVASLVLLAERAGVSAPVAAASAFAVQALGLGTGALIVLGTLSPEVAWWQAAAMATAAAGTLFLFRWGPGTRLLERFGGVGGPLPLLPWSAIVAGAGLFLAAWGTYGLSFWLLARGLVPGAALGPTTALRVFTIGYIIGWLALFAPGGLGVRELTYVGLLTPDVGAGPALAISLGSRLLLTATEIGAAGATLAVRGPQERRRDAV